MTKSSLYCTNECLEFVKKDNSTCFGKTIEGHFSFSDAKADCNNDINCNGIVDVNCDAVLFWTCKGKIKLGLERSAKKSCAWKKGSKLDFIYIS